MGQAIMSHLHHIDGLSTAAAQYQAYLERMRVAHAAEEEDKKVKRKTEGKKFQEHLGPEEENAGDDPEDKSSADDSEEATEPEAAPGEGSGSYYA
jgi:hypothetical protein